MSEPTTAVTFSLGILSGLLLWAFVSRVPATWRFWRRVFDVARREREIEAMQSNVADRR